MRRRRRRTTLRSSTAFRRRQGWWGMWLPIVGVVAVVVGIGVWVGLSFSRLNAAVVALPSANNSHGFIADTDAAHQVMLLATVAKNGLSLDHLAVMKVDSQEKSVAVMVLPTDLSDGSTTVAEYLRAGYYKEMQQAVEQQLALPLTGYVIERDDAKRQQSWVSDIVADKRAGWVESVILLPEWLQAHGTVVTSATPKQFLDMMWLYRDVQAAGVPMAVMDETAVERTSGEMVTLQADAVDPMVVKLFARKELVAAGTSVVVKNATNVSGLAALVSRYVTNMGGEVVAAVPADTAETRSAIQADKETAFSQELGRFLGIPLTEKARTGRERSDVELTLGTDALSRLGK